MIKKCDYTFYYSGFRKIAEWVSSIAGLTRILLVRGQLYPHGRTRPNGVQSYNGSNQTLCRTLREVIYDEDLRIKSNGFREKKWKFQTDCDN